MMFDRLLIHARALRLTAALAFGISLGASTLLLSGRASADTAEAKKIFTTRCMACHTFGKGVKIGPDLKGVTERRQRPWLLKFVRSSSTVIASGDPTATGLFQQFNQQRMPDWVDLSEPQVTSIFDWLAANGPDQQEPDARSADAATLAEIEIGRHLFHGQREMSRGGIACASCHSIRDAAGASGGVLARDLTTVYSQYQDGAMTQFLKHPCMLRYPESTLSAFLSPEESFAVKAYLRYAALTNQPDDQNGRPANQPPMVAKTVDSGGSGAAPSGQGSAAALPAGKRVTWAPMTAGANPVLRQATLPSELLFQVFPYVALAILILGLGIRHALARRRPEAIRPAADAAWQLFRGSVAWRIGLAITAALHLVSLIIPGAIRAWNGVPLRLYLLEGTGFVFGVVALIGLIQLMWRHVGRSVASTHPRVPEVADYALLSLLCVATISGLATAVLYRWGSSWAVGTVTPYIASFVRGEPATGLVEQMPFLIRLHVFSWFAVLAVVPFTSAAMVLVAAGDRVVLFAGRPIAAVAHTGRRVLAKLSPARWLWPDEDLPGDGGNAEPS
ncbi:MAG: c-type cytochrome [Deltaproteobacteria bacterium]|nr:MAG: c-type cytochrome [Deltaproteobacteria bacterium]